MEKFSAYRDPGTGIQPFLTPVPPSTEPLANLLLPPRYILAAVRTAFILVLLAIYIVLVPGLCTCLRPVPSLHRYFSHWLTAILGRAALFSLGLFWIPVEHISGKRRRGNDPEAWNPRAGDIIISNWVSWIELVWLAIKFNPIFVLPIPERVASIATSSPAALTSNRQKGPTTLTATDAQNSQIPIVAFRELSLLSVISMTGHIPLRSGSPTTSLNDLRKVAERPIVVLPECTTSNGRGLLRFSNLFYQNTPVKRYQVFVMCVRYDPPSTFVSSATHCIPFSFLNPLPHLFKLAMALKPIALQIRLLVPSESPSSQLFTTSETITHLVEDQLTEASAVLISRLGKLKRTNLGWEDKAAFLEFYHSKSK
ncbi:hypothetical protein AX15_002360 [Amanita polypyramis BW_CC]|nr:hypothetical protein AX15_002360 [Amanita polypyramis BW_CC]